MKNMLKKIVLYLLALTIVFSHCGFSIAFADGISNSRESLILLENEDNYEMVSSGFIEKNSDGNVIITDKYVNYVQNKLEESGVHATVSAYDNTITIIENVPTFTRSSSGGVTKVKWLSFNRFEIYLDNELSNKIVSGAGIGAALSVWIPDPFVTKIIATALGVSAGLISYNNRGNGVIVSGIYTLVPKPLATFYWIRSQ